MDLNMALIGICITLFIFLIGQLVAGIWWASKITTTLTYVQKTMEVMAKSISMHDANLYSKEDATRDLTKRDLQIEAAFQKIDTNRNDITEIRTLVKK